MINFLTTKHVAEAETSVSRTARDGIVQSFYGKKGVYLKQIATKGIFTGF